MAEETTQKLTAIADAQRPGHVDPALDPGDVLAMVSTMVLTWSPVSLFSAATAADPEHDHERRRQTLAETVRRASARHGNRNHGGPVQPAMTSATSR